MEPPLPKHFHWSLPLSRTRESSTASAENYSNQFVSWSPWRNIAETQKLFLIYFFIFIHFLVNTLAQFLRSAFWVIVVDIRADDISQWRGVTGDWRVDELSVVKDSRNPVGGVDNGSCETFKLIILDGNDLWLLLSYCWFSRKSIAGSLISHK